MISRINVKYGLIVFATIIVFIGLYRGCKERSLIESCPRYTIGTTESFYLTASGGRSIRYKYQVGGVEYEGTYSYAYDAKVPGGMYLVKFSCEDPNYSKIYQEYELSETVEVANEGWRKIPKHVKRKIQMKN